MRWKDDVVEESGRQVLRNIFGWTGGRELRQGKAREHGILRREVEG